MSVVDRLGGADQAGVARVVGGGVGRALRAAGRSFAFVIDTVLLIFRRPFALHEFIDQSWFVAKVSILPTVLLGIPFTVLGVFTFNIVLVDFGAADASGALAAIGSVTQIGPVVTVLVVAGAGATAMCADLGARTIREELDALKVMGVDPIQTLVVPRVLAAAMVSVLLFSVVVLVGLAGGFAFSVFVQHVNPGAFGAGLTALTDVGDVMQSLFKAFLFGAVAGFIACFKGFSVRGGPAGVGNAVNETVVYAFVALFAINIIVTTAAIRVK